MVSQFSAVFPIFILLTSANLSHIVEIAKIYDSLKRIKIQIKTRKEVFGNCHWQLKRGTELSSYFKQTKLILSAISSKRISSLTDFKAQEFEVRKKCSVFLSSPYHVMESYFSHENVFLVRRDSIWSNTDNLQ